VIRKKLLGRFERKYVIIGLVVISLLFVGFTISKISSGVVKTDEDTPVVVEPGVVTPEQEKEISEFTERRFVAIPEKGWLGGVLAGIAYYFGFPLWLLRLIFVLAVIWLDEMKTGGNSIGTFLIVVYVLLWIFMPSIDFIPADFTARTG